MLTLTHQHRLWQLAGFAGTALLFFSSFRYFWLSSHSTQQLFLLLTALLVLGLGWSLVWFWQRVDPVLGRGIGLTFGLGLLIRVGVILLTPMSRHFADTCLIMDAGSVMSHDVRPYDHRDKQALRAQLRTDAYAFLPPMADQPAEWNYHTSSHLPLGMLLYGVFDIWWPHVMGYRLGFSVFDALLGCFVYWWLWLMLASQRRSELPSGWLAYLRRAGSVGTIEFYALGLVLLSPVLLKGGTVIMESKGTASLLMVASLCFFHQKPPLLRQWISPALLGLSIAFMGVGVFLVPYFAAWLLIGQSRLTPSMGWPIAAAWRQLVQFGLVALVCAGVWFIPFVPDIMLMVKARVAFSTSNVLFASPWRPLMDLLPDHWLFVKQLFSVGLLGTTLIGFLRGRLAVNVLTASLFLYFLTVSVTDGSMDRVYMSLLMTMLLTIADYRRSAHWLVVVCCVSGLLTLLAGAVIWVMKHYLNRGYGLEFSIIDGYTNALFCLLFLLVVGRNAFGKKQVATGRLLVDQPLQGVSGAV